MKNRITLNHLSGISPAAHLAADCLLVLLICSLQSCSGTDPFFTPGSQESTLLVTNLIEPERQMSKAPYEGYLNIATLDIFVFNDDGLRGLDSHISMNAPSTPYIKVSTTHGDKLAVAVANLGKAADAVDIRSYDQLEGIWSELKDEDPMFPIMTGEGQFHAGDDTYAPLQMTPLLSNICLDFVKVNFAGRGYSSKTLDNACAYLTNVSGSAEILRQNGFRVNDLVNAGGMDWDYISGMKHPEMLWSRFTPGQWKPVNLYCYPNDCAEGVLGSEHTKLVVQGDIDGETYYYPMEINQEGFGYSGGIHGLGRNIKYSYSLTITRKGSSSPDTAVGPEAVMEKGWMELHPGQFITGHDGESIHVWCDLYPEDTPLDIDIDDLEYDVSRGIYSYELDEDGHGVTLNLEGNGTGMFTIDAGPPVNQGFLIIVVVNP